MNASDELPQGRLQELAKRPGSTRVPIVAASVGAGLLVACFVLGRSPSQNLAASWLVAFLFWFSVALGCMFFVLVHFAARSGWSVVLRRIAENVMATLPLLALLFVPVLLSIPVLFEWARPGVAGDEHVIHRRPYLNVPFFALRAVAYFVVLGAIAWWYRRQSVRQDRSGDHAITRGLQAASGPALIAYSFIITFAAFDWLMSLQSGWYSTVFGVYFFAGCAIAGYATLALGSELLRGSTGSSEAITVEHLHDIGKFLLAFVAFWTYIAFSQYLLIWYTSLPEETPFFLARWRGSWRGASVALAMGHFAVPFFVLLSRAVKRRRAPLVIASVWMLLMHYFDLYWLVMPVFHAGGMKPSWLDAGTVIGFGCLVIAAFSWLTARSAPVPVGDPRLAESLSFENV